MGADKYHPEPPLSQNSTLPPRHPQRVEKHEIWGVKKVQNYSNHISVCKIIFSFKLRSCFLLSEWRGININTHPGTLDLMSLVFTVLCSFPPLGVTLRCQESLHTQGQQKLRAPQPAENITYEYIYKFKTATTLNRKWRERIFFDLYVLSWLTFGILCRAGADKYQYGPHVSKDRGPHN